MKDLHKLCKRSDFLGKILIQWKPCNIAATLFWPGQNEIKRRWSKVYDHVFMTKEPLNNVANPIVWPDFCRFIWPVGDQIDRFYGNLIGDLAESEIDKKVDVQ